MSGNAYTLHLPSSTDASSYPLCSLITAALVNWQGDLKVNNHIDQTTASSSSADGEVRLDLPSKKTFVASDQSVARLLARLTNDTLGLYGGSGSVAMSSVDHWVEWAATRGGEGGALGELDGWLKLRTFIVGRRLSLADLAVFAKIGKQSKFQTDHLLKAYPHVKRWFTFVYRQPVVHLTLCELKVVQTTAALSGGLPARGGGGHPHKKGPASGGQSAAEAPSSQFGKLEGGVMGEVVVRFPPEPSGYLHVGHAKAAMINNFYARSYNGTLIIRFDDTNPAREKEEFQEEILEDCKRLGIKADKVSFTSDYFPQLQDMCTKLIKEGKAYVDDTPQEQMRLERGEGIESRNRQNTVEDNLKLWDEMLKGTPKGQECCVRARIDMQAKNKCMRDPAVYRCVTDIPHHRTKTAFTAYPMYDFCCPVVDALEGVTHAMRTSEYADRYDQYKWMLQACGLRDVHVLEFSRLNFVNTVLSKRKLQWFVDEGIVDSWKDPRFPTVQGMLRRGLQVKALWDFIDEQGPTKANNLMEWDKLWTKNKQIIDPIVPRYSAVGSDAVLFHLVDGPPEPLARVRPLHPKTAEVGEAAYFVYKNVLIEKDDAALCEQGEEVTLMRWGNCVVDRIDKDGEGNVTHMEGHLHLDGDVKKTKKKLHWLPALDTRLAPCVLREYDHIISKKKPEEDDKIQDLANRNSQFDTAAMGDPLLKHLKEDSVMQLERRGYFRVDQVYWPGKRALVLIKIPDGKSKPMSAVSTKLDPAAMMSGGRLGGAAAAAKAQNGQ